MKTRNQRIIEVIQASELPEASLYARSHCGYRSKEGIDLIEALSLLYCGWIIRVRTPSEPTTRRITKKDWDGQPVVWVRDKAKPFQEVLVSAISDWGTGGFCTLHQDPDAIVNGFGGGESPFNEYSFDRKTWHPFTITEPGTGLKVVASTEEGW